MKRVIVGSICVFSLSLVMVTLRRRYVAFATQ